MFSVFIDDSGTAPNQRVAIASGLIVPSDWLVAMTKEWDALLAEEEFTCFHTSELVARNPKSDFSDWDEAKVSRVTARVCKITIKYAVSGFSCAINKADYDEVLPTELRGFIGESHYTWAISSLIGLTHDWAARTNASVSYVFDWAERSIRKEIDDALQYAEVLYPGKFEGNHSFHKRCEMPFLQLADHYAWTCYQWSLKQLCGRPMSVTAQQSWSAYRNANRGDFSRVQALPRLELEKWVDSIYPDSDVTKRLRAWKNAKTQAKLAH